VGPTPEQKAEATLDARERTYKLKHNDFENRNHEIEREVNEMSRKGVPQKERQNYRDASMAKLKDDQDAARKQETDRQKQEADRVEKEEEERNRKIWKAESAAQMHLFELTHSPTEVETLKAQQRFFMNLFTVPKQAKAIFEEEMKKIKDKAKQTADELASTEAEKKKREQAERERDKNEALKEEEEQKRFDYEIHKLSLADYKQFLSGRLELYKEFGSKRRSIAREIFHLDKEATEGGPKSSTASAKEARNRFQFLVDMGHEIGHDFGETFSKGLEKRLGKSSFGKALAHALTKGFEGAMDKLVDLIMTGGGKGKGVTGWLEQILGLKTKTIVNAAGKAAEHTAVATEATLAASGVAKTVGEAASSAVASITARAAGESTAGAGDLPSAIGRATGNSAGVDAGQAGAGTGMGGNMSMMLGGALGGALGAKMGGGLGGMLGGLVGMGAFSKGGLAGMFGKNGMFGGMGAAAPWLMGGMLALQFAPQIGKIFGGIGKSIKKLFHFDDPINDKMAVHWGLDFGNLFTQGVDTAIGRKRLMPAQAFGGGGVLGGAGVTVNLHGDHHYHNAMDARNVGRMVAREVELAQRVR
jgi:hypothetical protein